MRSHLRRKQPGYPFTNKLSCSGASNWLAENMTKLQRVCRVKPEPNHTETRLQMSRYTTPLLFVNELLREAVHGDLGQTQAYSLSSLSVQQLYSINAFIYS